MDGLRVSIPTKDKIRQIYEQCGNSVIFSRVDIMKMTGIKSSSSGDLIKKMKEADIVVSVRGYGKGKYRFKM